MNARRSYWHLEALGHKPSDYEIVTSRLLYYPARGFEVQTPLAEWYRQHQQGSPLTCSDWGGFSDPRETTYSLYTRLQSESEILVDGLLRGSEETGYDTRLRPEWLNLLERVLPPLRYPVHGLQMLAAYVGQMAPEGRITIAATFQAADEMRRVQRLAYRMRQLQQLRPAFGSQALAAWERDPLWQPLRRLIERLLVCYDWGEAFVALEFVLKPAFDELFMQQLARLAESQGDDLLARILHALNRDCLWHRDWSRALAATALRDRPENQAVMEGWIAAWQPEAQAVVAAWAPVLALSHADVARLPARIARLGNEHWQAALAAAQPPAAAQAQAAR